VRIALVLGSGGARGYAHIGVIEELRERGHDVVAIAGTSMGALIGGLEAAGKLDTFTSWVRGLTQRDVLRLLDPTLSGPGAIKAERVVSMVSEILDGAVIEDLPIPYTAVAADIGSRREVWFQEGPVDVAIRASIAIPSVITPVMLHGRLLADGALVNPLPVEPTTAAQSDVTVAVSLSGTPGPGPRSASVTRSSGRATGPANAHGVGSPAGPVAPEDFARDADDVVERSLLGLLAARFARTAPATGRVTSGPFEALPGDLRTIDVINLSLETMQALIERFRMAANPPDVLVSVPSRVCATFDFHRANEVIEVGRTLARDAFDRFGL